MYEQKIIKKQLLKNMLYNFIAFTLIFTIFGAIIFNQVKVSLYNNVNNDLETSKEKMLSQVHNNIQMKPEVPFQEGRKNTQKNNDNPRIIHIIRNENGEIQNIDKVSTFYQENINYIEYNKNNLDIITNIKIGEYNYRTVIFKSTSPLGEIEYIQLLINVEAEEHLINNFFKILLVGIAVIITLSIIASYIVAKRALAPVVEAWKKEREFVQNASHELRTPLTIIQAKQELLLKEPESRVLDKSEDIILTLNEVKRLSKLTTDLMTLARADANIVALNKEKVKIDDLILEVTKPYIEYANMQEKQIELKLNYSKEIFIDASKIHQLMVILLDNAIKYTEKNDKIEVVTMQKEGKCIIEIKDTGIGISEESLKHIFDRFYREDKARNRETGGSGLGLSIAHSIVELHYGTIKVSHNNKKGTIFIIKLK